jgi:hypothetical protein
MRKKIIFFLVLGAIGIFSFVFWKYPKPKNFRQFPIQFASCYDVAYTDVEIEGQFYSLALDLGMGFPMDATKEVLAKIKKKKPMGTVGYYDVNGNHYQIESYIIPEIKIGGFRIYNVPIREEGAGFRENTRLQGCEDKKAEEEFDRKIVGRIGSGMFSDELLGAVFLDLGHSKFFIIKDITLFQEDGYSIKNMLKIPYEWNHGVVIEIETDFGKGKFLLDTGVTFNVLKEPIVGETPREIQGKLKWVDSSKFQIGGKDFGAEEFCSLSISPVM